MKMEQRRLLNTNSTFARNPDQGSSFKFSSSSIEVKLSSEGSSNVNQTGGTAVASLLVGGEEYSLQRHGYNIVILDSSDGTIISSSSFDLSGGSSSKNNMIQFLRNAPAESAVLVATQSTGSTLDSDTNELFKSMGASIINSGKGGGVCFGRKTRKFWCE
jgi:hypothetical protein